MKKHWIFYALLVILSLSSCLPNMAQAADKPEVLIYYGQGCPHCAVVEKYIEDNNLDEVYSITLKEVYSDSTNAQELTKYFIDYNVPANDQGVPFAIINDQYFIGDQPIIQALESGPIPVSNTNVNTDSATNTVDQENSGAVNIWTVSGAALVDAINPCAFAVLIILMGTILATKQRKKALTSGLAFILAIFMSYTAMGLGLYSAVSAAGFATWLELVIGILAILLGLFNIKDAIWYGKGFLMEVPLSWRPRLKKLIKSITNPIASFGIGVIVSLFLLPCTSGPYIVIVGMLGASETLSTAVRWLLYYNLIFILPMLVITLIVYGGLNPEKLENIRQRRLRSLHAIAGIIMLALGLYLIIW